MDKQVLVDLKRKLFKELNFELDYFEEINAGMSNKLFCLAAKNAQKLLLKIYWEGNSDTHLKREYQAIELMRQNGIVNTPEAYFKNHDFNYAVYSFEEGIHKSVAELNESDIRKFVDFLIAVHSIKVGDVDPVFIRDSDYTLAIYAERKKHRIKRFLDALENNGLPDCVLEFNKKFNPVDVIEDKYEQVRKMSGIHWEEKFPQSELRYSPQDLGPHNCLFRGSEIIFLDFEYFCLIDPLFLVAEFTQHDKTFAVPDNLKQLFLREYADRMNLSEHKKERLSILIEINELHWLSIFLDTMIPANLDQMRFSMQNFNEEEFIRGQISKFKNRLKT